MSRANEDEDGDDGGIREFHSGVSASDESKWKGR